MDTGEQLFDRLERYFGIGWTKALVIIVALGCVATAVAAVVNLLIVPLYKAVKPLFPLAFTWSSAVDIILLGMQIGGGVAVGSLILDAVRRRSAVSQLEDLLPQAREVHEQTLADNVRSRAIIEDARDKLLQSRNTIAASALILEAVTKFARDNGALDEQQLSAIEALLNDVPGQTPDTDEPDHEV